MSKRDPYTTASADPANAAADYPVELVAVEDVGEKIFRAGPGSGRLTAHLQAIRLSSSLQ